MAINLWAVGYDTADAEKLARVWSEVLGRPVDPGASAEFAAIETADGGPVLRFHQVPEGKRLKNRRHPALISTASAPDTEPLLQLGAPRLNDVEKGSARWTT